MPEETTDTITKPKAKPRFPKPSTLLNHIEAYCQDNDLGQDDTIGNLTSEIEADIITEAKRRG